MPRGQGIYKVSGTRAIWLLYNNEWHWCPTQASFFAWGYSWADVQAINLATFCQRSIGQRLTDDGSGFVGRTGYIPGSDRDALDCSKIPVLAPPPPPLPPSPPTPPPVPPSAPPLEPLATPYGKFQFEGTFSLAERETIIIRETITELREREVITSEIEREIIERLREGETITEIIAHLVERGIITPSQESQIISYFREIGMMPAIAAEVPAKLMPWAWIIALGSVFTAGIVVASAKKKGKKA